jgi:hypothetical protein
MLPIRNKEPPLFEIELALSQTLPFKLFGFYLVLISTNSYTTYTSYLNATQY